eukprot:COSAG01_NODE_10668_length_2107_cov_3.571926_2_plen_54_part_00
MWDPSGTAVEGVCELAVSILESVHIYRDSIKSLRAAHHTIFHGPGEAISTEIA